MQRMVTLTFLGLFVILGWQAVRFYRDQFPETSILNQLYPVVSYNGPNTQPDIDLQAKRPQHWVSLRDIPKAVQGAVLVSEDWAFFQHKGYDPVQIENAIREDLAKGKFKRGASTLTQQVVKNVFLDKDKTLWRKLKEFILAVRMEKTVSKNRILEVYFNIAEWGEGIFGIHDAAAQYFQKSASELTPREGAFLAMLLPSPKRYSQSFRAKQLTRYASRTVQNILNNMRRAGYISEAEYSVQKGAALAFETRAAQIESGLEVEPEPDPDNEPTTDVPEGSSQLGGSEDARLQKESKNPEE